MQKTQLQQKKDALDNIDFDRWSEIARTDPERFESMRSKIISACIDSAPRDRQQRLRGLQWQIDCLRAQSSNPLSACIKISRMMWDTLQQLGNVTQELAESNSGQIGGKRKPAEATILSFSSIKNNAK